MADVVMEKYQNIIDIQCNCVSDEKVLYSRSRDKWSQQFHKIKYSETITENYRRVTLQVWQLTLLSSLVKFNGHH